MIVIGGTGGGGGLPLRITVGSLLLFLIAPSAHSRYAVRERVSENELIYDEVIRMFLRFPKNN